LPRKQAAYKIQEMHQFAILVAVYKFYYQISEPGIMSVHKGVEVAGQGVTLQIVFGILRQIILTP